MRKKCGRLSSLKFLFASICLSLIILTSPLMSHSDEEAGREDVIKHPEFRAFKSAYDDLIKEYQFSKAVKWCEEHLNKAKTDSLRHEMAVYLDEARRQFQIFDLMLKRIVVTDPSVRRTLIELEAFNVWVNQADETGFSGTIEKEIDSVIEKKWTEVPPEIIYHLMNADSLEVEPRLNVALFCYDHNLPLQANWLLVSCARRKPEYQDYINQLLSRKKGVPIPRGGFIIYQGQFVTPQEKAYLEQGWVQYEGKWMSYADMMVAQGLVNWEGRWGTRAEAEDLTRAKKRLEELRKLVAAKGVINKPGCDKEKLPWSEARTRETDHYRIKTNLSPEALNDIAYLMECLYFNHKKIFMVLQDPPQKADVWVFKNEREYKTIGRAGGRGVFQCGDWGSRILTFYWVGQDLNTTTVLLHEGTHQFIVLSCGPEVLAPIWVHEGLATYYEVSKFDGQELKTNLINGMRLSLIHKFIRKGIYIPLTDFINISQAAFGRNEQLTYAEAWSLVYFLLNGKNGHYRRAFQEYFYALKGKPHWPAEPQKHRAMFEKVFNVSLEVMEEEWKDYILQLTAD